MGVRALLAVVFVGLLGVLPGNPGVARAGNQFYVRTDGSDSVCNGLAYASSIAAPNCAYQTINYAISAVTPSDVVNVGPGTYTPQQINFSQETRLAGMPGEKPVLKNTTGPGTWFICYPGASCNFSHLVLDADGRQNVIGLTYQGSGTVTDVDFKNFNVGLTPDVAAIRATGTVAVASSTFQQVYTGVSVLSGSASSIRDNTFVGVDGGAIESVAPDVLIDHNRISAFQGVFIASPIGTTTPAHGTVVGNDFSDSHIDLSIGRDLNDASSADVHFNRFGAYGGIDASPKSVVKGENNWWGCNSGPLIYPAPGYCAKVVYIPIADVTPWLIMTGPELPASARRPTTVSVDFRHNSAGEDVSGAGTLPDGVEVAFSAQPDSRATVDLSALTVAGMASVKLSPTGGDGLVRVRALLDAQSVTGRLVFDRARPTTQIASPADGAVIHSLALIRGTAADPRPRSGLARVEVAIRMESPGACSWWQGDHWAAGACGHRTWLPATGTARWRLQFTRGAGPFNAAGRYSIFSRATDRAGNHPVNAFTRGVDWVRLHIR